ncbi:MAG: DJ-1/PfpI family protein [Clostridiales bacterium]|nr:DJ-1/PfpI family protein [Clostridiales bacterium]
MAKAYAIIADGTEEVECLGVVDVLRRAGVTTEIVSVGELTVKSSHGVVITADRTIAETDFSDADLIFTPGGMPGTSNIAACEKVIAAIEQTLARGKYVAAICAAPALVLGANGFLRGKSAICFPGFEKHMNGADISTGARVVTDGQIITARGLGCTLELGLALVGLLVGEDKAAQIKEKIQF